nr:protein ANTI-SILENCING 1-like [Lolium perenne]
MDASSENIQFSWGNKRAKNRLKMDTQFYGSFTFDNVNYSLYDCVYLFKNGEPEPYIGKILKIWQQNQAKKVKILWFFSPDDIRSYLSGPVAEKEIFLASGDGTGLADINPLEAIAGKCTVVCLSKDERNRQPTPREQEVADYIFCRFFDVGNCTLSDKVPEKIGGLEVNSLLNPKDAQVTCYPDQDTQGVDQKLGAGLVAPLPQSAVEMEDENPVAAVTPPQSGAIPLPPAVKEEDKAKVAAVPLPPAVKEGVPKPTQDIPKRTQKDLSEKMPSKKLKLSQDPTGPSVAPVPDVKVRPGPLELTTRQAVDRSKWFKPLPWHEELRVSDEEGRLVYIQNLDIQFAASDIEELIREALQLTCRARPINHPTYDDPNNGKAYAVFKSKKAADVAISKINSGLVVGGRPLYCSKGLLKIKKPSGALVGHLTISNQKTSRRQQEDQKKAVSTSHCSQPNTIEYDLALDWMLVREKQARKFSILHKKHADERK